MSIHKLGNSSVATVPTLLDLVLKGKLENQQVKKEMSLFWHLLEHGMNINAICVSILNLLKLIIKKAFI